MQKPTRNILALTAGSLVLGLIGAGAAVADDHDTRGGSDSQEIVLFKPDDTSGNHSGREYAVGRVVSRSPLTVRSKPTTRSSAVGHLKPQDKVGIVCKQHGEEVDGNTLWYRLYLQHDDEGRPGDDEGREDEGRDDESKEDQSKDKGSKDKGSKDKGSKEDSSEEDPSEEDGSEEDGSKQDEGKHNGGKHDEGGGKHNEGKHEGGKPNGGKHEGGKQDESREDEAEEDGAQEGGREDENADGSEQEGREDRALSEHKKAWVSARYVKNLESVEWCD
ncbi:hypothetical protein ABZ128_30410 [Streptomyces sp. NPDC006326]|uniref:hypothetical protein n=1 Tax=Streptomyces sp. NPDC006326 TaxID=3156752 RepID=UPI0033BD6E12